MLFWVSALGHHVDVVRYRDLKQRSQKQGLAINAVSFICVFYQPVDPEGGGVGFHHLSDTLAEGAVLNVFVILSGCSLRMVLMRRVPIPDPVPPPGSGSAGRPAVSPSFQPPSSPHPAAPSRPALPIAYSTLGPVVPST